AASTLALATLLPYTTLFRSVAVQEVVAPAVVDDPLKLAVNEVQVNAAVAPAFTFGGVLFMITDVAAVAVHPLAGLVTVRVYVPAASTVGLAEVAPDTIWPPL